MFAREFHIRARRAARPKLHGEQLDITFPRRGRPSKFRRLERAGQMRLTLTDSRTRKPEFVTSAAEKSEGNSQSLTETLDAALQMTFPIGPLTDDEMTAEFERLFPL
jgi:hypothetical protein